MSTKCEQAVLFLIAPQGTHVKKKLCLDRAIQWFNSLGTEPDFVCIKAPGFSGKKVTYSRIRKRLSEPSIEEASSFELLKMEADYQAMSDYLVEVDISPLETSLTFCCSLDYQRITETDWKKLALQVYESVPFTYGFSFELPKFVGPYHYAHGGGYSESLTLQSHEDELRGRWMRAQLAEESNPRDRIIRQVYSLQFLSHGHLELPIEGTTLRQWIQRTPDHGILESTNGNIWSWSFSKHEEVEAANLALFRAGLLVAWDPALVQDPYHLETTPRVEQQAGDEQYTSLAFCTKRMAAINELANAKLVNLADALSMALHEISRMPEANYLEMTSGDVYAGLHLLVVKTFNDPDSKIVRAYRDNQHEAVRKGYQKLMASISKGKKDGDVASF